MAGGQKASSPALRYIYFVGTALPVVPFALCPVRFTNRPNPGAPGHVPHPYEVRLTTEGRVLAPNCYSVRVV